MSRTFFFPYAFLILASPQIGMSQEKQAEDPNANNGRKFTSQKDSEYWMNNMLAYHNFSVQEIQWATGLDAKQIAQLTTELKEAGKLKASFVKNKIKVLPYPGGRHPRIGFLDGAIRPQRETKVSVFCPWDHQSYVVIDVPEAIWSNLGLTYLAHTHIPTIFDKQKQSLQKMEWDRSSPDKLFLKRELPNGIQFSSTVETKSDHVLMRMSLTNGTPKTLTDLRVQNCVMLKSARGFNQATNENKRFIGPYVTCHNESKNKWLITAWKPIHRPWANPPCPCLHSDPKFPDCKAGESQSLTGWFSFYEGKNIDAEIERIEKLNWWK